MARMYGPIDREVQLAEWRTQQAWKQAEQRRLIAGASASNTTTTRMPARDLSMLKKLSPFQYVGRRPARTDASVGGAG
jgi:hypothetical protein